MEEEGEEMVVGKEVDMEEYEAEEEEKYLDEHPEERIFKEVL